VVNDEPVSKPQIVLAPTNKEEKSGA